MLLEGRARFMVGERFFERGRRVTIGRSPKDARPGLLALVKPEQGGARASVMRMLGSPDVARDVIDALMLDRGLRRFFPPGVELAAAEAREQPFDAPGRRDLRDLATFTIDPVTARDFDDAISAQSLGEGRTRVWVHLDAAEAHGFTFPGDYLLGFGGNAYPTRDDDGTTSWWSLDVIAPASERAIYEDLLAYRSDQTPFVAIVNIVAQDPDRRAVMGNRAAAAQREHFDLDRHVDALEELYRDVIAARGDRHRSRRSLLGLGRLRASGRMESP